MSAVSLRRRAGCDFFVSSGNKENYILKIPFTQFFFRAILW
jgi:hypothetical protein